jgi:hypothetical protein
MGASFQEFAAGTTDQESSDAAQNAASNLVSTLQTAIYVVSQPGVKVQGSDVRKIVNTWVSPSACHRVRLLTQSVDLAASRPRPPPLTPSSRP